jgi:hypothetical protein
MAGQNPAGQSLKTLLNRDMDKSLLFKLFLLYPESALL